MEAAFALLLPLVAGYIYVSEAKRLKYKYSRDDGHRLYFRIAYYGLAWFIAAAFALGLFYAWLAQFRWFSYSHSFAVDAIKPLLKEPDKASGQLAFIVVCVGSVLVGLIAAKVSNSLLKGQTYDALLEAAEENDLELLLLTAAIEYKSISVTMTSNKVYVGLVLHTPEPRTDRRVIALLPYMSGYREETGKVIFTTFYDQIYEERAKERDDAESNDFRLVLPIDKMISVSFFDLQTYAAFNARGLSAGLRRVKVHTDKGRRPRTRS